jgi:hypothetical protein
VKSIVSVGAKKDSTAIGGSFRSDDKWMITLLLVYLHHHVVCVPLSTSNPFVNETRELGSGIYPIGNCPLYDSSS